MTRRATIGEIIPAQAWPALEALIGAGKHTAKDFLPVLKLYKEEMLEKEVLPEYAAYVLEYACQDSPFKKGVN